MVGGRSYLFQPPRRAVGPSGINPGFPGLSQYQGWVTHVLLTRSPLSPDPKVRFSLDLHVLSAPPAFVLSQDQTLHRVQTALLEQTLLRLFGIRVDSFPVRRHTAGHDACLPAPEGRRATGRPVQALLMTLIVKHPQVPDPLQRRPSGVTRSVASARPSSVEQVLQSNPARPLRQPLGGSPFSDFRRPSSRLTLSS